ncbi:universal stress protein [Actinomycetospora sp. TBRC 11914]|uniref:universal stress protein n=1 Tax=Actinomycetospora sp. TBRC 11914 TaxID=2729387 RepID=UPI00145F044D|nr:universal stress protein [Actinomycetospora sp. TBRC 11914]NMO89470.1 universal stress protein [Actinomycetospora sp. TBRC 11914]
MTTDTTGNTGAPTASLPAPRVVHRPTPGGVVVGIDGSDGSRAAVEAACDEAARRGLPLAAVVAWTAPEVWVTPYPLVPSAQDMQAAAVGLATRQIGEVLAARAARGASTPTVELVAASGPAPVVLERLSADAALLVVGHRGRGAVASRLIGSVGLSTVVHAHCSVLVVRAPQEGRTEGDEHESHAT